MYVKDISHTHARTLMYDYVCMYVSVCARVCMYIYIYKYTPHKLSTY